MLFGHFVKENRVAKGITQGEIQRKTGIKREYISRIESGELPNPTISTIKKIVVSGLGMPLSEFFKNCDCAKERQ